MACLAWFALATAIREPEKIHADVMLVRTVSGLVALVLSALGAWLIVPVIRREIEVEAARPAPSREQAVQRAFTWGVGMAMVSLIPLIFLGLFHFLGAGVIPNEAKIGPAIWASLLLSSAVLLMRAKPAGAALGAVLAAMAGLGLLVSVFVTGGGGPMAVIIFALAFVAAPRLWQIRRDLLRTS